MKFHVQPLFDHHEPSRHRRTLPRRQPLRGQPRTDAGRVSRLSGSGGPQLGRRTRNDDDALGHAAAATCRWIPGNEHQEYDVAALARLVEAGEPLPGPGQQLAEYAPEQNPETKKKDVVWFALSEDRPLFAFAGTWTTYNGDRGTKSKPVPGPHQVYGFLTTSPNAVVEPIHPKAMR